VTTAPAGGPFLGALNGDDQFALFVHLGSDDPHIGNVQRYGDLSSRHLQLLGWNLFFFVSKNFFYSTLPRTLKRGTIFKGADILTKPSWVNQALFTIKPSSRQPLA
jgi:hypothetical protein